MNQRLIEFAINGFKALGSVGFIAGFIFGTNYSMGGWWLAGVTIAGSALGVGCWLVVMYLFVTVVHRFTLALSLSEKPVQNDDGTHEVKFWARGKRQPNIHVPNKKTPRRWGGGVKH